MISGRVVTVSPPETAASIPHRIRRAWLRKGWLKPFRNAGVLALGGGAQGLIQLAAIALATQALGASGFGTLVLLDSARRFVGGVIRLRSKEVIMRFGARALQAAPPRAFERVLSFAAWLDILSALAAVSAIGLAMGTVVGWLNMPPGLADEARIYGTCVVFVALSSSPEALLRLFERFDLVAVRNVIAPSIQVVGGALALVLDGGLTFFLVVWFAAYAIARLTLIGMALWELRRRGRLGELSLHPAYLAGPEPGAWRFAAGINAMRILGKLREHGTTFIVGALLDSAAVGLVHIAQRLGQMPRKPVSKILTPAFFPEIAHQTASGKHRKRRKTVWRSTLVVGVFGVLLFTVLAGFGRTLLAVLFGPAFAEAYPIMLLFAAASVVGTLTFAVRPALVSAGRIRILLATGIVMAVVRVGLLFVLIPRFGLNGAALAELITAVMVTLVVVPAGRQELKRPRDGVPVATATDTHWA